MNTVDCNGVLLEKNGLFYVSTLCNPHDFMQTVSGLSEEKVAAIEAMGFGVLQKIACTTLFHSVCSFMVRNLDPLNETVEINGKTLRITVKDFERIMGVQDGGDEVGFSGSLDDSHFIEHAKSFLCNGIGELNIETLKVIVRDRMAADDKFCIAYAMYAISMILSPESTFELDDSLLISLTQPRFICFKNWATYAFVKLMSGVLSYNSGKDEFMGGCIIFLQLYYFDVVGDGHPGIQKNVTPIMAWGDSQATDLVARLEEEGHLKSLTMMRTRANEHAECGTLKDSGRQYIGVEARKGVHNDGFDDNNKVDNVNSRLDKLEEDVNVIQPFLAEFRKRADSFERLVANFKGDVVHLMVAEILRHVNAATKTPIGHMDKAVQYPECEGTENAINSQGIEGNNCVEGGYNDIASRLFGKETTIKSSATQRKDVVVIPARMVSKTGELGITSTVSARSQMHSGTRGKKRRESKTTVARHHLRDISNFYESNVDNKRLKVVKGNRTKYVTAGPYKLRHAISYKDEQLVNFIFLRGNTSLSNTSTTEKRTCVARNGSAVLYRDEIMSLGPMVCVLSCVINYFVATTEQGHSPFWVFPTYFAENANGYDKGRQYKEWVQHTRILCNLKRFDGRIKQCERIFIPLHEKSGIGHWFLLVVHLARRVAEIWDSCPSVESLESRSKYAKAALIHLDHLFCMDIFNNFKERWEFSSFTWVTPNAPRQTNAYDCGIYVIRNIQDYGKDWAREFYSEDQRANILLHFLNPPTNEIYNLISPNNPHQSS